MKGRKDEEGEAEGRQGNERKREGEGKGTSIVSPEDTKPSTSSLGTSAITFNATRPT